MTVVGPASEGIQKKPSVSRPSSATLDSALQWAAAVAEHQLSNGRRIDAHVHVMRCCCGTSEPAHPPVEADEHGDGGQRGQAAGQGVDTRGLVQLGRLHLHIKHKKSSVWTSKTAKNAAVDRSTTELYVLGKDATGIEPVTCR